MSLTNGLVPALEAVERGDGAEILFLEDDLVGRSLFRSAPLAGKRCRPASMLIGGPFAAGIGGEDFCLGHSVRDRSDRAPRPSAADQP